LRDLLQGVSPAESSDEAFSGSVTYQMTPLFRSMVAVPLVGQEGERVGVLCVSSGPQGRKFTPEDLCFAMAVCAVAGAVVANVQLLGRLKSTIELLQVAAHDLRSPLTAIQMGTQLLTDSLAEGRASQAEGDVQMIHDSARAMGSLLSGILSHEAIRSGRVTLRRRPVAIGDEIKQIVRPFSTMARVEGRAFAVAIDKELPRVSADPARLQQIVGNLLQNAFRYSGPEGRVGLRVISAHEETAVELAVWDNGPGIPPEDREQVFRPFTRGLSGRRTPGVGSGLGLAIVDNLVRLHSGRIHIEDGPEGGACFRLYLPAMGHALPKQAE
jgi:signal transduction histidine kinase